MFLYFLKTSNNSDDVILNYQHLIADILDVINQFFWGYKMKNAINNSLQFDDENQDLQDWEYEEDSEDYSGNDTEDFSEYYSEGYAEDDTEEEHWH